MRKTLICLSLSFISQVYAGQPLVSIEEMLASNSAAPPFAPKAAPVKDSPLIELSSPKLNEPIASPTVIDLKFQTIPPSYIKPETFKVLYGSFEIDITKRLLNVAKITESGVLVQEATLPKGKHKLLVVIEDTLGRRGNKSIDFEVK